MEVALGDCFLHGGNGVNRSTQVAFFFQTSLNLLHLLKVSRALPFAAIMGKKRERRLSTPPSVPVFCLEEVGEVPRRRQPPPPHSARGLIV